MYGFEVGCWLANMLLLLDVDALLGYQPPTIGPTLGTSFLLCRLTTPSIGVAQALGLQAVDRNKGTNDGV